MAAVEKRRLVLLAPVYADVRSSTPVELRRTANGQLRFVFATRAGLVEKEAACVNSLDGCRCDFVRLLRSLALLTERQLLAVHGEYAITIIEHKPVATLELSVKVRHYARIVGKSLTRFEFALSHLQGDALAIARRSETSRLEARKSDLLAATCSSCHVVGCRLHRWQADDTLGPKAKLHLPDVFQSLMVHMETEQGEIRDDVVDRPDFSGIKVNLTDLPRSALHLVVCFMEASELAALSGVCSVFRHLAYAVVPGLNLVLYEHQRKGLKWMLYRETPSLIKSGCELHPFLFPRRPGQKSDIAIDLLDMKVVADVDTTTRDLCGGMFCDEPGLGKTITMLALILRTKGQSTRNARLRAELAEEAVLDARLHSLRPRGRSVAADDLVGSGASLIVVPDPLVEHWKYQIEAHVKSGELRTFIDETSGDLPSNSELAAYDVVVTSFSRLAREWRLHRPVSAQEMRIPERYGFEGPKRYSDGTISGAVSSLLTVRWVRVIVDEGHELGGQTPTRLMEMARILSGERRWVMTGTPTPNTLQSADLRYMHGLLLFLRNKPYGQPDGSAWTKAIADPFEHNEPIGFYRLQSLLSRILMRHTKASIREILPEPVRHTVYIDPTPSEYAQYNAVAAAVRANLVITNIDPVVPGNLHLDSLMNPINRKEALRVVSNLRFACCGGVNTEVVLPDDARLETINMLSELEVDGDNIATVMEYLRNVTDPGMTTECGSCKRKLQLLMVLPCGHLCCADCVEDRVDRIGPSCFLCNEVFDPEVFQELQPGFEFREIDDDRNKKNGDSESKQQHGGQGHASGGCTQNNARPQQLTDTQHSAGDVPRPNRHYWTVDASKIFYAATRVRELRKDRARRNALHAASDQRRTRYVKVIIFSQFTEMIWRTKLAFKQQGIPTADFITLIAPKARMRALKRFREDASLNVLLLSEMGSHGLDLSFVTHVFLMEQVWDKSLETQVISRAHRMGAEQAVVVEQLWMRGSVESDMAKVNELSEDDITPPRIVHDLGPPVRKLKRKHSSGDALLNVAGKKKRKRDRDDEVAKVPENKRGFLQRKLDYVLNHLKLLDEDIAAPSRQVRFSVVDDKAGTTIRQAIHMIPDTASSTLTSSTTALQHEDTRTTTQPASSTRPTENAGANARTPLRECPAPTVNRREGASNQQHLQGSVMRATAKPVVKRENNAGGTTSARRTAVSFRPQSAREADLSADIPIHSAAATTHRERRSKRPRPDREAIIVIDDQPPAAISMAKQVNPSPEVIVIDDSSSSEPEESFVSENEGVGVDDRDSDRNSDSDSDSNSDSDASVASSSSSNSRSADNEDHFGSDDSGSDSDESDSEGKALVSQLITVAQRHFARHRQASDARAAAIASAKLSAGPGIDDEETETETETE